MPKLKGLSTGDLELRADRLSNSPSAQDIQDARDALLWCARVIGAADGVVRAEAMILANARKIRGGENQKAPPPLCRG